MVGAPLVGALPSALPIEEGGHETRPYVVREMFANTTSISDIALQSRRLRDSAALPMGMIWASDPPILCLHID